MWATSIGSTFSHSPVPGLRKSGIPDGTETPAPVSTTVRFALRSSCARRSISGETAMFSGTGAEASDLFERGPVVAPPDLLEPVARLVVADRPRHAGLVELARAERPPRRRLRVFVTEVRGEHRRVVGGERAGHAGSHEPGQRVLVERGDHAGAQVRDGAHVEHGAAPSELRGQPGVLHGTDPVADPIRPELLQRRPDGAGAG